MKRTSMLASIAIILTSLLSSGGVYAVEQTQQTQKPVPSTAETPVTADLTTPNTPTPNPPSDPADPNNTENEQVSGGVTGEEGNLGIAYYPKSFKFTGDLGADTLNLHDSGSNSSEKDVTYNIGVKDNTRQRNSWTLTATLSWVGNELPGSTITVTNPNDDKVRKNINDGVNSFSNSDLVPQSDVQGEMTVTISKDVATVMKKNTGTVGKGTYDYSLGSVGSLKLMIPDATDLVAKSYSGNVNWNLQISPDTSTPSAG